MKRILILANSSSGLYQFRYELVKALTNEYEVYASLPDDTNNEELTQAGLKIVTTPINRRGINPIEDIKLLKAYFKLLSELKPDAVLTYTIKPNVYGGWACARKKIPYMANITGLGSALENPGPLQLVSKLMYKAGLKGAACVFLQNSSNLEFVKKNKMVSSPMELLPGSGVNTERFPLQPWPEEEGFIYVARVMKQKGIEEYLACARAIREEYPQTHFHILGYCEEDYEQELKNLQEQGIIDYHGSVKDVRPYLSRVRCIIHPSFYPEGMSNVCLEAASSGRAVITTDRPGCRETVRDGVTGYIVPTENKEALIGAVRRFMALSDEAKQAMGTAGREYVKENFNRQIVVDKYREKLSEILA